MEATYTNGPRLSDPAFLEVVIVNYNGNATLLQTMNSLMDAGVRPEQIILSDDGSTDGSPETAQRTWPAVRLVRQQQNCGIVNKVRNAGLELVSARYVFLTDNDIIVGPGNLERFLDVLQASPDRAIVTPRLVDFSNREEIFYDGKNLHFLALSCDPARGRPVSHMPRKPLRPTFGGGIMMIDTRLGQQVGWMDEGYLEGWASDAEFQLRARAMGFEALHDSNVSMLHFGKDHGTSRALGQMSNRYRLMLTYYSVPTLLLLLPSLLVFELLVVMSAVRMGVFGQWLAALKHTWRVRHALVRRRSELTARRRLGDAALLGCGPFEFPGVVRDKPLLRGLMRMVRLPLELNWWLYRLFAMPWGPAARQARRPATPGDVLHR